MITSHDVARLAGVSQPTVSRALNDSPKVSEAPSAGCGRRRSPSATPRARSVARCRPAGRRGSGWSSPTWTTSSTPTSSRRCTTSSARLGYELVLVTESDESGPVTERLVSLGLAGVVLATSTVDSILPARLRDRRMPFVYFNRTAAGVDADCGGRRPDARGSRRWRRAVADAGHTRAAAIFGPRNTSTGEEREQAVRAAFEEVGITLARRRRPARPVRLRHRSPRRARAAAAAGRPSCSCAPTTWWRSGPSTQPPSWASTCRGRSRSSASTTSPPRAGLWSG